MRAKAFVVTLMFVFGTACEGLPDNTDVPVLCVYDGKGYQRGDRHPEIPCRVCLGPSLGFNPGPWYRVEAGTRCILDDRVGGVCDSFGNCN